MSNFLGIAPQPLNEPKWRRLWWILVLAFVARAVIALSGDFVLHPDEIMQYLEPAHRLVFGHGISYWEYFYGGRSWLLPGAIAGVLGVCQWLGLDSPTLYIGAVKLAFCAFSLLIPYGMYTSGRYLFGEGTARLALLLGAFWYELVGMAHKPMTEFVATSLLFVVLILAVHPSRLTRQRVGFIAALGVLLVAIRFHYAFMLALVWSIPFFRPDNRFRLTMLFVGFAGLMAIGLFEFFVWGNLFHSYWVNLKANLIIITNRIESNPLFYLLWLVIASGGSFLISLVAGLNLRRRGFFLLLFVALLLPHMLAGHREYRFIFAAIPLWLLLFADFLVVGMKNLNSDWIHSKRLWLGLIYLGLISCVGIFNALPFQRFVYRAFTNETGVVNFIRYQDPIFSLYRHLSSEPSIHGLWQSDRPYFNTAGYYYLHKKIPFYDVNTWKFHFAPEESNRYVSHIVAGPAIDLEGLVQSPKGALLLKAKNGQFISLPRLINDSALKKLVYWTKKGKAVALDRFVLSQNFGYLSVWKLSDDRTPIKKWQNYRVKPDSEFMYPLVKKAIGEKARRPVTNFGIRFIDSE